MKYWKYLLVFVVLVSRLVELSLYEISDVSDWCWYLFTGGWFVLFFLTLWVLVRLRWRELAIFSVVLVATALPALNYGAEPISRFQDEVFRLYTLHRIRAVPLEEFLSKCKLIDYVDDDGARQQVGQCDEGLHSTPWFFLSLIYDPSGQFALPGYRRTTAWRLALQGRAKSGARLAAGLDLGSELAESEAGRPLVGNFYYVKIYLEDLKG
jgi:hypothetical protein